MESGKYITIERGKREEEEEEGGRNALLGFNGCIVHLRRSFFCLLPLSPTLPNRPYPPSLPPSLPPSSRLPPLPHFFHLL